MEGKWINVNQIIKIGEERGASDVHFISGLKPTLRINRDLIPIEEADTITNDDMWDIYGISLASGNVERGISYLERKKVLDCSAEINGNRLRVNVSYLDGVPVITTRLYYKTASKIWRFRSTRYSKKNDNATTGLNTSYW